jgi:PhnB protein
MARTSTYLNFPGTTEEAFLFYRGVFGTDFEGPVTRLGDSPEQPSQRALTAAEKAMIIHIVLPIVGGHLIMGADVPESLGYKMVAGDNVNLNLEPDTVAEAERLYKFLSTGGKVETPFQKMFWGAWYASFTDRFGIHWMVNAEG